jgi:periplasmic divalent cation tolerance protein
MAGTDAAGTAGGRESGQYLQVQTTTDSRAEAVELARAAVEARLAACGQVAGPVASVYWWNDELERAEEWFVFFKLPADRYEALAAFLAERHSYDEPEIVATPIVAGSASFLGWMTDETRLREPDIPRQRQPGAASPADAASTSDVSR